MVFLVFCGIWDEQKKSKVRIKPHGKFDWGRVALHFKVVFSSQVKQGRIILWLT
jgi:hypothetical protein